MVGSDSTTRAIKFAFDNPLPVQITSHGVEVEVDVAHLNVQLNHEDKVLIRYLGGIESAAAPSSDISGGAASRTFQINTLYLIFSSINNMLISIFLISYKN